MLSCDRLCNHAEQIEGHEAEKNGTLYYRLQAKRDEETHFVKKMSMPSKIQVQTICSPEKLYGLNLT